MKIHDERRPGTKCALHALFCAAALTSSAALAQGTLSPATPLAVERPAATSYRLVLPALLPGALESEAFAICGTAFVGMCDGTQSQSGYPLAVLWRDPHDIVFLAGVGTSGATGTGVNSSGVVVGVAEQFDPDAPLGGPFVWKDGALGALPLLHGASFPRAVSERGQIVGESAMHAVLWSGGAVHDLGTLGGAASSAYDITSSGRIVGTADRADGTSAAVQWLPIGTGRNGELFHATVELGTLGGPTTIATSINAAGQIAGWGMLAQPFGTFRAFVFEDGAMHELEGFGSDSEARSIGPTGAIVGRSGFRAVLWTAEDRQPIDLNEVTANLDGWQLAAANDIDASGRIVGVAVDEFGFGRACLLEPIPPSLEPPETVTSR